MINTIKGITIKKTSVTSIASSYDNPYINLMTENSKKRSLESLHSSGESFEHRRRLISDNLNHESLKEDSSEVIDNNYLRFPMKTEEAPKKSPRLGTRNTI